MEAVKIRKMCEELAYSKNSELSDEIFNATVSSLRLMWSKYGYAIVFGELSQIWSLEKAVPFFKKINLKTNSRNKIRTIATHYRRCCNGGVERVQAQLMNLWSGGGTKLFCLLKNQNAILIIPIQQM